MNGQEEEIKNITKIILLKSIQCIVYLNMNEKWDTFELFEKGKENRFDESKQRDDTVQNENKILLKQTEEKETLILYTLWEIDITI